MSEWQPIETAPKDSGRVLLASAGYVIGVGSFVIDGWVSGEWDVEPTHWMPLPEPPA